MTVGRGSPRIAVVGSLNMDLVVRAQRIPSVGETVQGAGDLDAIPGGKGANQAYAAAALGATVSMIGRIGNDPFGSDLLDNLARVGVATEFVSISPEAATGVALIVVDDQGRNSIVVSPGANATLTPDDVAAAADTIAAADALLLQLETPLPTVRAAAEVARSHRTMTVLDPAPYRPLPPDLLKSVDVIVPNESEAALLAGEHRDDPDDLARSLLDLGVARAIVTRGPEGATVAGPEGTSHHPGFSIEARDETAAGDAFAAAYAVAVTSGESVEGAMRFGNAAGALAASKAGAQTSLPSCAEVLEFLTLNPGAGSSA